MLRSSAHPGRPSFHSESPVAWLGETCRGKEPTTGSHGLPAQLFCPRDLSFSACSNTSRVVILLPAPFSRLSAPRSSSPFFLFLFACCARVFPRVPVSFFRAASTTRNHRLMTFVDVPGAIISAGIQFGHSGRPGISLARVSCFRRKTRRFSRPKSHLSRAFIAHFIRRET